MNAQEIAAKATAIAKERADSEDPREWTNYTSFTRYVRVLRSAVFWQSDARQVSGTVENSSDGRLWSYVIAECLDSAVSDMDFPDTTNIDSFTYGARISW